MPSPRALFLVVLAAAAFATSAPLARAVVGVPPLAVALGRVAMASALLVAIAPRSTAAALARASAADLRALAGAGALLGGHFALFFLGLSRTSLPAAVSLVSLEPLTVLGGVLLLTGARPRAREVVGVCLAAVGAFVVASAAGQGEHRAVGDALVLGAVALYGLYVAAARRLRDTMPVLPYAALVYAGAALALLPFVLASTPAGAWPPGARDLGVIALLAVLPTALGHTVVQGAVRTAPPALIALVAPGETVGALLIGAVCLGVLPTPREAMGAALVLLGGTVTALARPGPRT